jgi:hypothetical protein
LPPITRRACLSGHATKISSILFISVRFHKTRGTPRIGVDGCDSVTQRLLTKPYLARIIA